MAKAEIRPTYSEIIKPHEECGVLLTFSKSGQHVSLETPRMLHHLQNRGQDTAGMATYVDGKLHIHKGSGLVNEVFTPEFDYMRYNMVSYIAQGHTRYATDDGGNNKDDMTGAQPMLVEWDGRSLAISYNGNLPDAERKKLKDRIPAYMPKEPNFDTADIGRAIVSASGETWEEKIENGLRGIILAYSITVLTDTGEGFGLRCPAGTWPLWVGEGEDLIIFSSETRVNKSPDIKWREIMPGELVKATKNGVVSKQIFPKIRESRCVVQDMYGARKDSEATIRDGEPTTYEDFRKEAGRNLGRLFPIHDADVIIGIPETGIAIAEGYAEVLGKEATTDVVVKIDDRRAFIGKNDEEIHAIISGKLAYIQENGYKVRGKRVVVIDDTNIRGKSAGGHPLNGEVKVAAIDSVFVRKKVLGYIDHLREMGASRIDALFALPKFVDGCDMGYYIRKGQLVALVRREDGTYEELTEEQIAARIGADSVSYLTLEGLEETYKTVFGRRDIACTACIGGPHPLDIIERHEVFSSVGAD